MWIYHWRQGGDTATCSAVCARTEMCSDWSPTDSARSGITGHWAWCHLLFTQWLVDWALSKTDLGTLEPKYNTKTEFGMKRNNSFIALPGKRGCSRWRPLKLQACLEEGAKGFYREVQSLASFDRNCILGCQPHSSCLQVVPGSWNKRLRREMGRFAEERKKVT